MGGLRVRDIPGPTDIRNTTDIWPVNQIHLPLYPRLARCWQSDIAETVPHHPSQNQPAALHLAPTVPVVSQGGCQLRRRQAPHRAGVSWRIKNGTTLEQSQTPWHICRQAANLGYESNLEVFLVPFVTVFTARVDGVMPDLRSSLSMGGWYYYLITPRPRVVADTLRS